MVWRNSMWDGRLGRVSGDGCLPHNPSSTVPPKWVVRVCGFHSVQVAWTHLEKMWNILNLLHSWEGDGVLLARRRVAKMCAAMYQRTCRVRTASRRPDRKYQGFPKVGI